MKIERIDLYQIDLPLHEGAYNWADGKTITTLDTTIIAITTDDAQQGYGETCPLGPAYLPAYPQGVRDGIAQLAPHLIGHDPRQIQKLNHHMDRTLKGHPHVKSGIDIACWDILAKTCNLPLHTLLGGNHHKNIPLYRAISQDTPQNMANKINHYQKQGYTKFQLKVGADPQTDIQRILTTHQQLKPHHQLIADANTGWQTHQALQVTNALKDHHIYIEQPCPTHQQCLTIRQHTNLPIILDETIHDLHTLLQAHHDNALDALNIKISKLGGITKTKQIRDLAAQLGIPAIIEDTWGSDITTAAITHLAHSTPPHALLTATDFNSYNTITTAHNAPQRTNGTIQANNQPGLGITPKKTTLNQPTLTITKHGTTQPTSTR